MRGSRTQRTRVLAARWAALFALACAAGCRWNWDSLEPRAPVTDALDGTDALDDGAGPEVVTAPCGTEGAMCCDDTSTAEVRPCIAGLGCQSQQCGPCAAPLVACQGLCVDTQTHRDHCGACGVRCRGNRRCTAGVCD